MKRLLLAVSSVGYLFSTQIVSAASSEVGGSVNLGSTQGGLGIAAGTQLSTIISNAVTIVFSIAALLVLAMLIWGGIEWVLSGGDKEKVANARKRIIASLVGLALIALAYLIVTVIGGIFNFNVLGNLRLPSLDFAGNSAP